MRPKRAARRMFIVRPFSTALLTAEQLFSYPIDNARTELVRGRLFVREPAGLEHGDLAAQLLITIGSFVRKEKLGRALAAETGFTLERNPDTVRGPDVAFVRASRWPSEPVIGYAEMAPDLAVEVLSPSESRVRSVRKVASWLAAGTELVWVVDPKAKEVRVHRADGTVSALSRNDVIDGEAVLPGFRLPVSEVFG